MKPPCLHGKIIQKNHLRCCFADFVDNAIDRSGNPDSLRQKGDIMQIKLQNELLSLSVETLGAQMMDLCSAEGIHYLWQGDPTYWSDRAPTLFPFIARLTDNSYRYLGKTYNMGIHGFAAASEFSVAEQDSTHIVLQLQDSEQTRVQYPFAFCLRLTYRLEGNSLVIGSEVHNLSTQVMPFAIGGHPGFQVPIASGECFEDYYLEFSQACQPDRIGFTPEVFLSGNDQPYALRENRYLDLNHSLFDEDAIILKNMARQVALRSGKSQHSVTVTYPDMPYLGIWHMPHTDAPYVCIEPWTSLPSRQDIVEELSCKSDMIQLKPGEHWTSQWRISVN